MTDTAHRAALGAVLAEPSNAVTLAERLTADDFEPGWMQLVYTAIVELHNAGRVPDAGAVLAHLQSVGTLRRNDGGIGPFIAELYEEATIPPTIDRHIDAVLEQTYRRHLWAATTRIRQACTEWPLAAVLATVDRELTSAMQAGSRLTPARPEPQRTGGIPGLGDLLSGFTEGTAA